MAEVSTFLAWAESLESLDYYEVLRVPTNADAEEIQRAFHELSLRCHPDRFVDEGPEVSAAAAAVFKRAAEAYNVLRKPAFRIRYDNELARGKIKYDERAIQEKPKVEERTLHSVAETPRGKKLAGRADALISAGKLEAARIQLISATQEEPHNQELKDRLNLLYEAMLLQPGDFL